MKRLSLLIIPLLLMGCSKKETVYVDSETGQPVPAPAPAPKQYATIYDEICISGVLYIHSNRTLGVLTPKMIELPTQGPKEVGDAIKLAGVKC